MGKISKTLALFLTLIIATSCLTLLMVNSANAQTIPKPSVPEFTIKVVHHSVDQPAIYSIDPYTGENKTVVEAKHDVWTSVVVTIMNQHFIPYADAEGNTINLYYNVRSKGSFSENWVELENINYGFPTPSQIPSPPSEDYLELDYTANYSSNAQLDFQVQAMIGFIHDIENPYGGMDNRYYPVFTGESSGWSNTQTITIGQSSTLPSPSPTVPELSWLAIIPLMVSMLCLAVVLRHRKTSYFNK